MSIDEIEGLLQLDLSSSQNGLDIEEALTLYLHRVANQKLTSDKGESNAEPSKFSS